MKKILTSILLLAAISTLLSSCSNISNMSITKRHYRSGYFVDFGSRKRIAPGSAVALKTLTPITPMGITKLAEPIDISLSTDDQKNIAIPQAYVAPKKKKASIEKITKANTASYQALAITSGSIASSKDESTLDHREEVNVNVSFALIVICAIFIPPLGVGLMYGIHSYFWIDLILTLLFFFPGMIFALIVVLT